MKMVWKGKILLPKWLAKPNRLEKARKHRQGNKSFAKQNIIDMEIIEDRTKQTEKKNKYSA